MLIGVVGDYAPRNPTHASLDDSLGHAGAEWEWLATDRVPPGPELERRYSGLWIAPASPYQSMGGALAAIRAARERGIPLVGTWGGFQHVLVEYARAVLGVAGAEHAETSPDAEQLVVTPLTCSLAGRADSVRLLPGTRAAAIYGTDRVVEDFFCRYGLNPAYRPAIEQAGLRVTGQDDEGEARIVELDQHPFFVATLFCFQTRSRPARPHPLTAAFAAACARRSQAR